MQRTPRLRLGFKPCVIGAGSVSRDVGRRSYLVNRFLKWLAVTIASSFLCVVIGVFWVWHRTKECHRAYLRVQRGDSEARVVELCGQPGYVSTELRTNLSWEDAQQIHWTTGKCVREFHY